MPWASQVPLIPRQLLFGNPDKAQPQLSPDGVQLSYLAPLDGVLNVWVGPADNPAGARPITHDSGRGIRFYTWAYTNRHILYIQDKDGDENWRIYSVEVATATAVDLTPLPGVQARIEAVSPEHPAEILISLNERNPQLHDLYVVNIQSGERRFVLQNEGFVSYITDDQYTVHFAQRMTADGGMELLRQVSPGSWQPWTSIPMEDALTTGPIGLNEDSTMLFMRDSRERDTGGLVAVDLATGEQTLLSANPQADAGAFLIHPTKKHIQAVAYTHVRRQWEVLDDAVAADFAHLATVADGDFDVVSATLDNQHWVVAYTLDNGPVRYYHYERAHQRATFLFTNRHALEGQPLARMHGVVIPARDGLNLVSYYTLPLGSERLVDGSVRPVEPLATILLVHGGPWGRDVWGYHPLHQWLANRGYAVLSVNFRSSTGFGKAFVNAGNLEWGAKMHDDLLDAVHWVIAERIADPQRIAIMGGSYGGYATLAGLTFTPTTFACGVDIVGPANLVTLLETVPPYWEPMIKLFTMRIGDHRSEAGRAFLTSRSPLTYVDCIQRPLLIGQGANDPRVKQAESDQIVQAMQAKEIPVTYVLYPDEGHSFARPENNLSFYAVAEAFLAQHLEERFEPIGNDFAGSSIQVSVGREQVPGLSESLSAGQIS